MPSTQLWRVARVAAHLDVSKKQVYALIRQGCLKAMQISPRGIRVLRSSVDTYIHESLRAERTRRREVEEQVSTGRIPASSPRH